MKRFSILVAGWLALALSVAISADDAPAPKEPGRVDTEPRDQTKDVPAPRRKPSLDDDLLKSLDPNASPDAASDADRLERIIQSMRDAQKRIESQDTGDKTRELQAQVIKDLDALIELLKQQQQNPSSSRKKQQKQQQKQAQPQTGADPQNSAQQKQQPGDNPNQKRNDKAKQSSDTTAAEKSRQEEQARRQQMIKDVWGHLPPAIREQLSQMSSEKYLPKYEDQVRRYYESLAEKNRKKKGTGTRN